MDAAHNGAGIALIIMILNNRSTCAICKLKLMLLEDNADQRRSVLSVMFLRVSCARVMYSNIVKTT